VAELHVTNGDVAAGAIAARLGVRPLPWRDVLHEGPVPQGTEEELVEARVAFLAAQGWADADRARAELTGRDAALRAAVDHGTRVVLWFEDDLYDQLQLLQVLDRLRDHHGPILLVDLPRPPRGDLGEPYGHARALGPGAVAGAGRAWAAFRAPDPRTVQAVALVGTPGLPDVAPALWRHLEQLPAAGDGLARTERQILDAVREGARSPGEAFLAVSAADERPFLADSAFAAWLAGLMGGETPLVSSVDGALRLTDAAEAVRAGRADRWALGAPVDRWHGGVHLSGVTPAWRWDRGTRRVVAG
jgi:hypothetical protein